MCIVRLYRRLGRWKIPSVEGSDAEGEEGPSGGSEAEEAGGPEEASRCQACGRSGDEAETCKESGEETGCGGEARAPKGPERREPKGVSFVWVRFGVIERQHCRAVRGVASAAAFFFAVAALAAWACPPGRQRAGRIRALRLLISLRVAWS